jgi:hypothetical protein
MTGLNSAIGSFSTLVGAAFKPAATLRSGLVILIALTAFTALANTARAASPLGRLLSLLRPMVASSAT